SSLPLCSFFVFIYCIYSFHSLSTIFPYTTLFRSRNGNVTVSPDQACASPVSSVSTWDDTCFSQVTVCGFGTRPPSGIGWFSLPTREHSDGLWRSLVARFTGVEEVGGVNHASRTM